MKYFCYEKNFAGRWIPNFYTEPPHASIEARPERSTVWKVDSDLSLREASSIFPCPKEGIS